MSDPYVLVLYYSSSGGTANLAKHVARGVRAAGMEARLRTVPAVHTTTERTQPPVPEEGAVYCTTEELGGCAALALGSATRFGNMASPLKHFFEASAGLWMSGALEGKPAGVFCSSNSMHGGQESTLLTMMVPLLHHGMIISGVPYSVPAMKGNTSGGTPYGPSHYGSPGPQLDEAEAAIAEALGARLADLAVRLA